jgi:glycosyltransferase involved in cell wall biosynthesis
VLAELVHLAVSDPELRAELRARGERRLEDYAWDRTAQALRAAVEQATGTIRWVLEDQGLRAELGRRGRERAAALWWAGCARATAAVYRELQ